jgi:hypothetical protein
MERSISQVVRTAFQKMDELIQSKYKENSDHHHFKTEDEMKGAMMKSFNPYDTFSCVQHDNATYHNKKIIGKKVKND